MTARPMSVSIVAWLLIVLGTIALVTMTIMIVEINTIVTSNAAAAQQVRDKAVLPLEVLFAILLLGTAIIPIAGIAMLSQKNWGRWLYVVGNPAVTAVGFAIGASQTLIPSIIFYVVVTFFLFLPRANAYFSSAPTARAAPAADVGRGSLPFG